MSQLFKSIYERKDLERRTRLFYEAYARGSSDIENVFIESYGIKYKLVFGDAPFPAAVYWLLENYYRNEHYIKKSFVIHELLHSQSVTFTEYPIYDSRADIVSINGHSTAFEIKTKYDSLTRLAKQISDYSRCFEYVYVICSNEKAEQVGKIIPQHCGIYTYDASKRNVTFIKTKKATLSPFLCPKVMLESMSKEELCASFGVAKRAEILTKVSSEDVNCAYKKTLKTRYDAKWESFKKDCCVVLKN